MSREVRQLAANVRVYNSHKTIDITTCSSSSVPIDDTSNQESSEWCIEWKQAYDLNLIKTYLLYANIQQKLAFEGLQADIKDGLIENASSIAVSKSVEAFVKLVKMTELLRKTNDIDSETSSRGRSDGANIKSTAAKTRSGSLASIFTFRTA